MFGSSSPDRRLCDAVERNGVYFFRDHRGIETDLLIEHATTRTLVEAKAGQTVTGDALSTIRKVAELLTDAGGTSKAVFIHGGEARQERSGVTVLPWSEVGACRGLARECDRASESDPNSGTENACPCGESRA